MPSCTRGARVLLAAGLAVAAPRHLSAQKILDQFSSENLAPKAIGFDLGAMGGSDIRGTSLAAVRLDVGTVAPNIRVVLGLSYFRADLSGATIDGFVQRLRTLVIDPSKDDTINLGRIRWSDATGDLDLQYVMPQGRSVMAYVGLGASVHVRRGSGPAVNGTFVQDALNAITAGLNGTVGAEFGAGRWRLALEARGVLASGMSTAGVSAGVRYRWVK